MAPRKRKEFEGQRLHIGRQYLPYYTSFKNNKEAYAERKKMAKNYHVVVKGEKTEAGDQVFNLYGKKK